MSIYYQDEWVTLYHGDCLTEHREWLDADVLVTDPPYGLGKILHSPGVGSGNRKWAKFYSEGAPTWDASIVNEVTSMPEHFTESIIWGGNYYPLPPARGWLIWDKMVRKFSSGHAELAWTTIDQPIRAFSFSNGQLATEGKDHPTQKPVSLMDWCVQFTADGASVADPFAGSGSTLVAAKRIGRKAVGVELDERYCEVAAKRLAQGALNLNERCMS